MSESVSKQVVMQRIRNRMMEALDLASDIESLHKGWHPGSVINNLGDYFDGETGDLEPPVFSGEELEAIEAFQGVLNYVCDTTPLDLPGFPATEELPEWLQLRDAAKVCLTVFEKRGPLSEESPI